MEQGDAPNSSLVRVHPQTSYGALHGFTNWAWVPVMVAAMAMMVEAAANFILDEVDKVVFN